MTHHPHVFVIAGPNGAGKSTTAPALLRDLLGVAEYVNADLIAQGLSAFDTESVAFQAGRVMLERLRQLADRRHSFAFETTLATRGYAPWLKSLQATGYKVDLLFLWLPSPEMAVARVAERVRLGGHDVPEPVIRRRYGRGMSNFFHRYRPVADRWWLFDNTGSDGPRLIASGENGREDEVEDDTTWTKLLEHYLMSEPKPDIEQILADKYRIEAALRTAVREALARHKRAGNPVATWRDGKVVWLKPEEIPEISGTPP